MKRDLLCVALKAVGHQAPRPQGSFYVFPKTPIADDLALIRLLQEEGILAVPGSGSGVALTIRYREIECSLAGFERMLRKVR